MALAMLACGLLVGSILSSLFWASWWRRHERRLFEDFEHRCRMDPVRPWREKK